MAGGLRWSPDVPRSEEVGRPPRRSEARLLRRAGSAVADASPHPRVPPVAWADGSSRPGGTPVPRAGGCGSQAESCSAAALGRHREPRVIRLLSASAGL